MWAMRNRDLGSQLQLSTTEERRTRRIIGLDLLLNAVTISMMRSSLQGIVATLVAVVVSTAGLSAGDCVRLRTMNAEPEIVLYRLDVRLQGFASLERDIRISRTEKRSGRLLAVMLVGVNAPKADSAL